jgi:hypothetical protein
LHICRNFSLKRGGEQIDQRGNVSAGTGKGENSLTTLLNDVEENGKREGGAALYNMEFIYTTWSVIR